jgi:hypothetical protein
VGAFGVLAEDPLSMGVGAILTVGGFLMSMYKEKTRHDLDLELERHERLGRSEGPQR